MTHRVLTVCVALLASVFGRPRYDYDACEGQNFGSGYYNLAGERGYNRNAELVCDFNKRLAYDERVTDIAWIRLDDSGSCRRTEPIRGNIDVKSSNSRSDLTISQFDERDYGVYRCFGTLSSGYNDLGRYRSDSRDHVYMDVDFFPADEPSSRYEFGRSRSRYLY